MRTLPCHVPVLVALALSLAAPARADGPGADQVGDPDSFGRSVVYLGRAATPDISLAPDCGADPNCVALDPQTGSASFQRDSVAAIALPADAAHSLICFTFTPLLNFEFSNPTDERQLDATFQVIASVSLENELLNDPTLIDPATRMPYGGKLNLRFRLHDESRTIDPGERAGQTITVGRPCFGGVAARVDLIAAGFSEEQATEFFHKPMRAVFGISGLAGRVSHAFVDYGVRVYGDR